VSLPANVDVVRVRGYWYDQDGSGAGLKITFTPSKTLLVDTSAHAYIRLEPKEAIPHEVTSYFYADLIASNDPDLSSVVWTVALEGQPPTFTITVPYDAPLENVGEAEDMKAIWLTAASA
jgi:hypothetical protein